MKKGNAQYKEIGHNDMIWEARHQREKNEIKCVFPNHVECTTETKERKKRKEEEHNSEYLLLYDNLL
jgi:hypothetical protein